MGAEWIGAVESSRLVATRTYHAESPGVASYLQVSLGPLFPELVPERRPVFDAQHAGAERPG